MGVHENKKKCPLLHLVLRVQVRTVRGLEKAAVSFHLFMDGGAVRPGVEARRVAAEEALRQGEECLHNGEHDNGGY